jgi:polysaccharide export outer membrane protein
MSENRSNRFTRPGHCLAAAVLLLVMSVPASSQVRERESPARQVQPRTPVQGQVPPRDVQTQVPATAATQPVPSLPATRESLGEGDTVRITVFQNPDLTTEARISERGTITFPLVGEINLNGLSPTAAETRIAEALRQGNFVLRPQVSLSVTRVRSRQVAVLGQVVRPGRYPLDDTSSKLSDILALAGGIGPTGDDTVTMMTTRNGKTIKMDVDVSEMYRSGDLKRNVDVENGDVIYVQRAPVFYIYGEVVRAGAYRLEPNMTVMQALSLGGGVTPRGTDKGLKIHRRGQDGKFQELNGSLTAPVVPNDVIYIRESLF